MNMLRFDIYLYSTLMLLLFACAGEEEVEEIEDPVSMETGIKFDLVINNIPSPMEIIGDINESDVAYNTQLTNSADNLARFTTTNEQALNLGVYGADMSYAIAYEQNQDAITYLNASRKLADKIGVTQVFDKALIERFEANLGRKDSLVLIGHSAFEKLDRKLRSNERMKAAAMVLAGGWIEAMYVATEVVKELPRKGNAAIYERIGRQKYPLENLLELLQEYEDDPAFAEIIEALKEVENAYAPVRQPAQISSDKVKAINKLLKPLRQQSIRA